MSDREQPNATAAAQEILSKLNRLLRERNQYDAPLLAHSREAINESRKLLKEVKLAHPGIK